MSMFGLVTSILGFEASQLGNMDTTNTPKDSAAPKINSTRRFREEALGRVSDLIMRDRNSEHGEPEDNLGMIGELWTVLLGKKLKYGEKIADIDVARLMTALKLARSVHNPMNVDNWDDGSGYCTIGGALSRRNKMNDAVDEKARLQRELAAAVANSVRNPVNP